MKYVVASVDEIPPGQRKIVDVDGRAIGVFNVDGEYFAVLNRCPHQGGPLCKGNTLGFLRSAGVGEFHFSRAGEILRCPWHGWEYDLRSGQSWFDPARVVVRRYEVSIEPGAQLVAEVSAAPADVSAAPDVARPPGMEGLQPGPYVAETFPVSVEQRYVLVEVG
jgi:3-phenylpropionate/trans-cinnamate dioxygenase ferredoxin subunit